MEGEAYKMTNSVSFFSRRLSLISLLVLVSITVPTSAFIHTITHRHGQIRPVTSLSKLVFPSVALGATTDAILNSQSNTNLLTEYLTDARSLGAVRFVVVGSGAILETVGSFDNLRYADTVKGKLATISSESPCFECHIRLAEVKEVRNVIVQKFEKLLRITRFLGGRD